MRFVLLLIVMLGASGRAYAQAAPQGGSAELVDQQARAHFEAGKVAFSAGNFVDALDSFRKAYSMSARPQLLYNIAVTLDRLRQDAEALQTFERYLEEVPDVPERPEVIGRIEILRRAIERHELPQDAPGTSSEPEETQAQPAALSVEPSLVSQAAEPRSRTAPWVALAASGTVFVVGGVLLGIALADRASVVDADRGVSLNDIEGAHDRVPVLSVIGSVMLGIGAVGGGLSIAWLTLSNE